ncbi:MAG: hypothetical protein E6H00_13460 [Bacillati bacterium ANGP1]|uniref:Uncharacterized protein n=1 Tax=Candidatus Segetimicrobium genomatis TaxID=2569760 RepID=A0A537JXA4_9BACT|nr:MAG: hypothetical protein E6H00_13460 [Terrabacteria group bacterium ANGP1]
MRHVIGYLLCLVFVALVLACFGELSPLTKNSTARVGVVVNTLEAGAGIEASIDPATAPVEAFSPLHVLGDFVAIFISPVGAIGLGLYLVVIWALPAR